MQMDSMSLMRIPFVIKPIVEGAADVVIGSRFVDKNGTAEMPPVTGNLVLN